VTNLLQLVKESVLLWFSAKPARIKGKEFEGQHDISFWKN
jgi:hypothetical protein